MGSKRFYAVVLKGNAPVLLIATALAATGADAAVVISSQSTQNMSCSNGVCAPTSRKAILNVGDLETMLASGNVTVTTTGAGVQSHDIDIKAPVTWSSGSTLMLDAYRSIAVDQPVSVMGVAGLALVTKDGGRSGTLSIGSKGNVTFANLSTSLSINGTAYTLVGDIKTLASDIAANPSGEFALAGNYNASADGTYQSSPVSTLFSGSFEGLGNVISNLSIAGPASIDGLLLEGLFAELDTKGTIENIGLVNANVVVPTKLVLAGSLVAMNGGAISACYASGALAVASRSGAGGLAGGNIGTIANSYATASLSGKYAVLGGLAAYNLNAIIKDSHATGDVTGAGSDVGGLLGENGGGTVTNTYATGNVTVAGNVGWAGGLMGLNGESSGIAGTIENSYATGKVLGGRNSYVGGLVGTNGAGANGVGGVIVNAYATGAVAGKGGSEVGGLVGDNGGIISFSYSTGSVGGGAGSDVGGLIGYDVSQGGSITDAYWDTDTSGITNLSQGAGNIANDPGITGLTTQQFQSGLPQGFDPKVWAENANILDGFPYLPSNPPAKTK